MDALPLFYHQPVPFNTTEHGKLRFSEIAPEFSFAANANVIPLLVTEVAQAARHYPLVFMPGEGASPPVLVAVVGLGDGINRFVGADGQWRANTYIPAYVRRYPFLPMKVDGQNEPILAIDTQSDWVSQQVGEAFVADDGKPTQRLQGVMQFQLEYLQQAEITSAMCAALQSSGVLEPRSLTWQEPGVEPRQIGGFFGVEEARLKALSAEGVVALHQADALGLAYAQLLSMSNLPFLLSESGPSTNEGKKKISRSQKPNNPQKHFTH